MREWRLWLKDWAGLVEENTDTMLQALDILCRLFFPCRFPNIDFRWDDNLEARGRTSSTPSGRIDIVLDPTQYDGETQRDYHGRIITTLLHEACHAYIRIFFCYGHCKDEGCKLRSERLRGVTGHGVAWQDIAGYIHLGARTHMKELRIRVNPLRSLIPEAKSGGILSKSDFEYFVRDFSEYEADELLGSLSSGDARKLEYEYENELASGDLLKYLKKRTSGQGRHMSI